MLPILTYVMLFASFFTAIVLYFIPNAIEYKAFVLFTDVVFVLFVIFLKLKKNILFHRGEKVIISGLLIMFLYLITPLFYIGINSSKYESFKLVLVGQTIPTMLAAMIINSNESYVNKLKSAAPIISVIFTIVSFFTAFYPNVETTGGFAAAENLNYQTISYMASIASSLNLFYIISYKNIDWPFVFKIKNVYRVMLVMPILNLLSIFIAGGRGGLVLFVVICLFSYVYYVRYINHSVLFKIGIPFFVVIIVFYSIQYASNDAISTNGFSRIISTITTGDDSGRSIIREKALQSFNESPICGHGLGSIFYEIEEYSHNCFTDVLVEGGILELILYLSILLCFLKNIKRLVKLNSSETLWVFLFMDSFVMSLFSGYYLACFSEIFAITIVHLRAKSLKNYVYGYNSSVTKK